MNYTSKILLFLFILFSNAFIYSQKTYRDSITTYFKEIENLIEHKDDYKEDFLNLEFLISKEQKVQGKDKVLILLKLYAAYIYKSHTRANKYNDTAMQLARDIGFKKGELHTKYNKAYLLFIGGKFDTSLDLVKEIEESVTYQTYPEICADVNTLKSYIYTERGEYDMALETGLQLLDIAEKLKTEYLLMRAYSSLSHYYLRVKNYRSALNYCLKGLHYIIRLKKIQYIFPKIDEIARMTSKLNDTKKALEVYEFYLKVEKKIPPPGDYIQSIVYMNMADIYISNQEHEKAQKYLSQALEMNYKNRYLFRIPRALILQAELFLQKKDTTNAIVNYEKSIEYAETINAFDVIKSNSLVLENLYKKKNQLSKSLEYKTLHKAISDSIFTNEKEQKIIILETKRKIKEVTHKKEILELENRAQKTRFNFIIIILILILVIGAFGVYGYLKVKNKNKILYRRTIELAEIQLEMSKKLNKFEKINTVSDVATPKSNSSKVHKTIDDDVKNIILNKLENLEKEIFFIDPNCSLRQVAQLLKTNPKYLSQVVNQEKKSNFNNYINELRINYLLSKLLTDEDFRNSKLSYIAASVGYNNLNTFNAAFKKRQGILPSYFISELIHESKEK
ncbi:helix-turn-helix domain-containing protein [Aquimarina sediminis]|uniref:helix-turn-helix domain-containing protein n=1 Tax=Aquimarina sediminis TaxID=2070536 RepID=UPI000CA00C5E|nr:helix-turn-helix domain-containing protein [Aquimarina sediminis]